MPQPRDSSLVLLAHNIRSLWNIGSFFRCADAFGVDHLYLTGYSATPPRKEISKTALGAEETVSWSHVTNPLDVIASLKKRGFTIVALEKNERSTPISDFTPQANVCLIVGHEILGVPQQLQSAADAVLHIPMLGKKESLNVAIACGIALYELTPLRSQRDGDRPDPSFIHS